ncbi:hypothetical protein, partial [Salinicola rhizosphaerae]
MAAIETPATAWLDAYRPREGYDTLMNRDGALRRRWTPLLGALQTLGARTLALRGEEIQALLHDNGITFNQGADDSGVQRQWRLDPLPLVVSPREWQF